MQGEEGHNLEGFAEGGQPSLDNQYMKSCSFKINVTLLLASPRHEGT